MEIRKQIKGGYKLDEVWRDIKKGVKKRRYDFSL